MFKQLYSATALNALGFGLGFFVQLLLARLLPVEEFGLFSFFFALNMTIAMIALFGFPQAVIRLLDKRSARPLWRFTLGLSVLLTLVIGALTYGALYKFGLPNGASNTLYIWALAPLLPLVILRLQSGFLKALHKPLSAILYEITGREALLLTALILSGLYVSNLNAANIFMLLLLILTPLALIALAHTIKLIKAKTSSRRHAENKWRWSMIALPMMLTVFAQMLMHRTDILMIGLSLDTYETGIYGLATKLAQIVGFPMMAMGAIFAPRAAKLFKEKKTAEVKVLFNQNRLFLISITAVLCAGMAIFAPYILPFFGESYKASYNALVILLIGATMNAFWGPVVFTMIMSAHEKITMNITLAAAALNIALNAALIPAYGIEGAALATILSINLKNAALTWHMRKTRVLVSQ